MVQSGTNKHYVLKYFDFLLKLLLPNTEVEWQIFASLYLYFSGNKHEWFDIKRHWEEKLLKNNVGTEHQRIRDIIALKREGLPYSNEFLSILAANDFFINIAAATVTSADAAAAAAAAEAANAIAAVAGAPPEDELEGNKDANERILELQATNQELEETIERLKHQLADSSGAGANADIPTAYDDDGEEEGKEEEEDVTTTVTAAAAAATASQGGDDQQNIWEQYSLIPRCPVDDLFSECPQ